MLTQMFRDQSALVINVAERTEVTHLNDPVDILEPDLHLTGHQWSPSHTGTVLTYSVGLHTESQTC